MRLPNSNWPSPNAVEAGLSAVGSPPDSRMMIQRSAAEVPDRSQRRPDPPAEGPPPPARAAAAARRRASSSWRIRRRSSAERLRRAAAAPASRATRASILSLACWRTALTRSSSATWPRHPGLGPGPGPLGPGHVPVELGGPPAGHLQAAQDVLVGADHVAEGDRPLDQVAQVGGLDDHGQAGDPAGHVGAPDLLGQPRLLAADLAGGRPEGDQGVGPPAAGRSQLVPLVADRRVGSSVAATTAATSATFLDPPDMIEPFRKIDRIFRVTVPRGPHRPATGLWLRRPPGRPTEAAATGDGLGRGALVRGIGYCPER
jgi:hypothetical protein